MTLRTNIHALTRDHLTTTPLGPAAAPPLIRQLEAAIRPNKGGGGSGGSKPGDVIDMTALALWEEIAADIGIHTQEAGLTPRQNRIEALQQWEMMDSDDDWAEFLTHVTQDWIDRIQALLSPVRPYKPSQPCPSCGLRFHGEDNQPPLNVHYLGQDGKITHPHQWRMECNACGSEWEGKTLGQIAHAMAS
jgi:hypothetical protein